MPAIRNEWKVISKRSDRNGNFFIVEEEPQYHNWKVSIHLAGEKRARLIGEIDTENLTMLVKRDKSRHFLREMLAYGFNYTVINDIVDLRNILMLETDGERKTYYLIPVKFIKENGKVKEFNKTGFEIQIFLRHEYLTRFLFKGRFEHGRLRIQGKGDESIK
jgi:hypothetical protein